ncbi:MAG: PspC domain-containing protein [Gammaproteobacteria bacterium]|nr:PspC domain-containing protein [Gammaproteobacteria bacterium]NND59268.1 PspC domain-containing protein [Gammaproteobacteria bacterium]
MSNSFRFDPEQPLYRNRETGVIMGVCAGLADYFDVEVWIVRVIAVICLYFFTLFTGAIYIGLGLVLKDTPLSYRGRHHESEFWRKQTRGGTET